MAGKQLPNKLTSGDSSTAGGDVRFLHDIEALSKALSLNPPSKSRLNQTRRSLPPPPTAARSNSATHPNPNPKPSIWRSLKSLSHIGQRRFDCLFYLQVKSIESLPTSLEGSFLSVHFHPSSSSSSPSLATRPSKASRGSAQFDETLTYRSSIYARSSGAKTHPAKYEARQFTIHVTCGGADLGRHMVDLTRLLPLTIAELEAERDMQEEEEGEEKGKWSTSIRLTGRARGAKLNVSFGYSLVIEKQSKGPPSLNQRQGLGSMKEKRIGEILSEKLGRIEKERSPPNFVRSRDRSRSIEDVRVLHEVLPRTKPEVSLLDSKIGTEEDQEREMGGFEGALCKLPELNPFEASKEESVETTSPESKHCTSSEPITTDLEINSSSYDDNNNNNAEFSIIEQGIESKTEDQEEINNKTEGVIENIHKTQNTIIPHESDDTELNELEINNNTEGIIEKNEENSIPQEESEDIELKELESIFENLSFFEPEEFQSSPNLYKSPTLEETNPNNYHHENSPNLKRSKSLDPASESVASEFLTMLGIEYSPFGLSSDSDPESPRERLLRQFEKESLAAGSGLFGLDLEEQEPGIEIPDLPKTGFETPDLPEPGAGNLELTEPVFGNPELPEPGFGNPELPEPGFELPVSKAKLLEDAETEALMREFGMDENSFLTGLEDTGFGSPIHLPLPEFDPNPIEEESTFVQTKDGGFLRSMNPAIFKNAKNGGNLVMQASSPVVLPAEMGGGIMDILQKLASVGIEKLSSQASKLMPLEDITGKTVPQMIAHDNEYTQDASSYRKKMGKSSEFGSSTGGEYVSLEDLAPLAMEKIEALSIEGLRIQSGMSDEEAPSNITSQSIGEISALEGTTSQNTLSLGLEGTGGLQLLDIKGDDDSNQGEDLDGLMGLSLSLDEWMKLDSGLIGEEVSDRTAKILAAHHANSMDLVRDTPKKKGGRRWGLLGNNFTVAIMVQLRDPLRNFEPVGTPMLSLIQVERVFVPPKPKIYGNIIFKVNENKEKNEEECNDDDDDNNNINKGVVSQYKISEVHVAGFERAVEIIPDKKKVTKWGSNVQQEQSGSRWLVATGMGKGNKHPLLKSKVGGSKSDSLWSVSSKLGGNNSHRRNSNIFLGKK